ncbi:hypothetical protein Pelo_1876 [Pelomyxa schiedti]|nr:hypothetical protein Pelo_1876 [Pelomyxa schiedti]
MFEDAQGQYYGAYSVPSTPTYAEYAPPMTTTTTVQNGTVTVDLRNYFHLPIQVVAGELGVCTTMLKQLCRKNGIQRWPYRKIQSLNNSIHQLECKLSGAGGALGESVRALAQTQLLITRAKKDLLINNPNADVDLTFKEWTKIASGKSTGTIMTPLSDLPPPPQHTATIRQKKRISRALSTYTPPATPQQCTLPIKRSSSENLECQRKKPRVDVPTILSHLEALNKDREILSEHIRRLSNFPENCQSEDGIKEMEELNDESELLFAENTLLTMMLQSQGAKPCEQTAQPVDPATPPPMPTPPATPPPSITPPPITPPPRSSTPSTPTHTTNTATSTPINTPVPSTPSTPTTCSEPPSPLSATQQSAMCPSITQQLESHTCRVVFLPPPPAHWLSTTEIEV